MHSYNPKITVKVMMEFEKISGVKALADPGEIIGSMSNLTKLLYCACKYEYPRLTLDSFVDRLEPEELQEGVDKLTAELVNFFQRLRKQKTEDQEDEEMNQKS